VRALPIEVVDIRCHLLRHVRMQANAVVPSPVGFGSAPLPATWRARGGRATGVCGPLPAPLRGRYVCSLRA